MTDKKQSGLNATTPSDCNRRDGSQKQMRVQTMQSVGQCRVKSVVDSTLQSLKHSLLTLARAGGPSRVCSGRAVEIQARKAQLKLLRMLLLRRAGGAAGGRSRGNVGEE